MDNLFEIFSTREIATILWVFFFLIFGFSKKNIRVSIGKVVGTLLSPKLVIPIIFLFIYISVSIYLLALVNIWEEYLLKDSIVWGIFSATVLMFKSLDIKDYKEFINRYIYSSLKIIFIFEFFINFFTFNLLIEIILIPIMAILVMIETVSEKEIKYKQVFTLSRNIQFVIGIALIIYVVVSVLKDVNRFGSFSVLKSVFFIPVLTVLIFPYIYGVKLYSIYELLFLRTKFIQNKDKKFRRKIQIAIITSLKLNLRKCLYALHNNEFDIMNIQNERDIEDMKEIFRNFKQNNKVGIIKRIYLLVEPKASSNLISKIFELAIQFLITINVLAIIISSFQELSDYRQLFNILELISVIIFTIEYVLRLIASKYGFPAGSYFKSIITFVKSPMAIIDLLAILPFYLPMFFPFDLRFLRILRLTKTIRILKVNRHSHALQLLGRVLIKKKSELVMTLFVSTLLIIFASSAMFYFEKDIQPEKFPNIIATSWWAIATLTTVGYGDVVPITLLGKLFSALVAVFGIGLVAIPTGIISSGFIEEMDVNRKGRRVVNQAKRMKVSRKNYVKKRSK